MPHLKQYIKKAPHPVSCSSRFAFFDPLRDLEHLLCSLAPPSLHHGVSILPHPSTAFNINWLHKYASLLLLRWLLTSYSGLGANAMWLNFTSTSSLELLTALDYHNHRRSSVDIHDSSSAFSQHPRQLFSSQSTATSTHHHTTTTTTPHGFAPQHQHQHQLRTQLKCKFILFSPSLHLLTSFRSSVSSLMSIHAPHMVSLTSSTSCSTVALIVGFPTVITHPAWLRPQWKVPGLYR